MKMQKQHETIKQFNVQQALQWFAICSDFNSSLQTFYMELFNYLLVCAWSPRYIEVSGSVARCPCIYWDQWLGREVHIYLEVSGLEMLSMYLLRPVARTRSPCIYWGQWHWHSFIYWGQWHWHSFIYWGQCVSVLEVLTMYILRSDGILIRTFEM